MTVIAFLFSTLFAFAVLFIPLLNASPFAFLSAPFNTGPKRFGYFWMVFIVITSAPAPPPAPA